jgi:hypothetical protein
VAIPKLVTVQGLVRDSANALRSGVKVTLTTTTVVRDLATGDIMIPSQITDTSGADGDITLQVPATDDPGFSPSGWTWRLKIDGVDRYDVAIPYARNAIELAELVPVSGTPGAQLYATLAALDALQAQVDAGGGGGTGGTPSATVVSGTSFGLTATAGAATAYSRGDHAHGTPATPTKTTVGLSAVDNTSDAGKPVSTAQATALALKAPLASPALTGSPTAPTQTSGDNSTKLATTAYVATAVAAGGGGGGGGLAPTFARSVVSAGDLVMVNSPAFAPVAGISIALAAVSGDSVELAVAGLLNQGASEFFELVVLVGGSIVRYASTGTASSSAAGEGDPAIYPMTAVGIHPVNTIFSLAVAPGDLSGGTITFGLAYKGPGGGKVFASANYPLRLRVRNDHQ